MPTALQISSIVLSLTVQIDGHGTLLLAKLFSSAAFPAVCSRGCEPRVRPFEDQVTFELREPQSCETTACRPVGRIDGFGDALESDPLGVQLRQRGAGCRRWSCPR